MNSSAHDCWCELLRLKLPPHFTQAAAATGCIPSSKLHPAQFKPIPVQSSHLHPIQAKPNGSLIQTQAAFCQTPIPNLLQPIQSASPIGGFSMWKEAGRLIKAPSTSGSSHQPVVYLLPGKAKIIYIPLKLNDNLVREMEPGKS